MKNLINFATNSVNLKIRIFFIFTLVTKIYLCSTILDGYFYENQNIKVTSSKKGYLHASLPIELCENSFTKHNRRVKSLFREESLATEA